MIPACVNRNPLSIEISVPADKGQIDSVCMNIRTQPSATKFKVCCDLPNAYTSFAEWHDLWGTLHKVASFSAS